MHHDSFLTMTDRQTDRTDRTDRQTQTEQTDRQGIDGRKMEYKTHKLTDQLYNHASK